MATTLLVAGNAAAAFGLTAPVRVDSNVFASAVAVGDVDGDGRRDIVVAGSRPGSSRSLFVYLQRPEGSFSAPLTYGFGWSADGLAGPRLLLTDLDGDGDLDFIVTTGDGGGRLALLRNGGDHIDVVNEVAGAEFQSIVATDVNGDGRQDILTTHADTTLANVYYGDGSGGIADRAYVPLGTSTSNLYLADVDGDGQSDLIYASFDGIYANLKSSQGFSTLARRFVSFTSQYYPQLAFGDLNEDGRLDIVSTSPGTGIERFSVYLQAADFSFGRRRPVFAKSGGKFFVQDVDGDAHADIAVVQSGLPDHVAVLSGNGKAQFSDERRFVKQNGRGDIVVDIDRDGRSDVVFNDVSSQDLAILFGATSTTLADLAVSLDLSSTTARVDIRNLGADVSQAHALDIQITARGTMLSPGTYPASCQPIPRQDRIQFFCQLPGLAGDGVRTFQFPFAFSDGRTSGQIQATASVSMEQPDVQPGNDRASVVRSVRSAAANAESRAGSP